MKRRTSSRGVAEESMPREWGTDPDYSTGKLLLEQLVQLSWIGLALCRLHHLPDEEAEELVLAGAVVGEPPRVPGHYFFDGALDGAGIGDLPEALRLDDGVGALTARPHGLEHFLGDLAGDRLIGDARQQARQARGRHLPR